MTGMMWWNVLRFPSLSGMGRNEKPQRSPGRQLRRKQGWMLRRYPQKRIRRRKRSGPEHERLVELTDGWRWGARTPVTGVWGLGRNAFLMKKGKYLSLNCTYKLNWSPFSRSSSCAGCGCFEAAMHPASRSRGKTMEGGHQRYRQDRCTAPGADWGVEGAKDELQGLRRGQGRTLRFEGRFLGAMGELGMTGRGGIEREERRRRSGVRSLFRFILSWRTHT